MAPSTAYHLMASNVRSMASALSGQDREQVRSVNLHCNQITRIDGLHGFVALRHLNLSSNHIDRIEGLETLSNLESLNLSSNLLTVVTGLESLIRLEKLLLAYNKIDNIDGLSGDRFQVGCEPCLHTLDLRGNSLANLDHLSVLRWLTALRVLLLRSESHDNPICHLPGYTSRIRSLLPNLANLDNGIAAIVTPRIDNAMQLFRSRPRPHAESAFAALDQALQDARFDSLETKFEQVLNTMQNLASSPGGERDSGQGVRSTGSPSVKVDEPERFSKVKQQQDASTLTDAPDLTEILKEQAADLEKAQKALQTADANHKTEVKEFREQIKAAREFVKKMDGERSGERKMWEQKEALLRQDVKSTDDHCQALEYRLDELLSKQQQIEHERAELQKTNDALSQELSSMNLSLISEKTSRSATDSEKSALHRQIELLNGQGEALTAENKRLLGLVQQYSNQLSELRFSEHEWEAKMQEERSAKLSALHQVESLTSKVSNLQMSGKAASENVDNLNRKLAEFEHNRHEERIQLIRQCNELKECCQKLTRDRAALKELTRTALQTQKRLARDLQDSQDQVTRLKSQQQESSSGFENTIQDLQVQLRNSNAKLELALQRNVTMDKDLIEANRIIDQQSAQLIAFTERIAQVEQEIHTLENNRQHSSDADRVRVKIVEDQAAHIKELQASVAKLERDKRESKGREESLLERLHDYKERFLDAEQAYQYCQDKLDRAESTTMAKDAEGKRLQSELSERERVVRYVEDELGNVKSLYEQKHKDLEENHRRTEAQLAAEIEAAKARLASAESSLALAQNAAKEAQAASTQAQQERDAAVKRSAIVEREMRVLLNEIERKRRDAINLAKGWSVPSEKIS